MTESGRSAGSVHLPLTAYIPVMKLGLQISSFTWPAATEDIAATLARVVQTADEVGFDSIWVMDHFFQIRGVGPAEEPMLEGFTTLGYPAAHAGTHGSG